ncbi:MAG: cyclic nucleotide-binding domain-containing protein [Desulfobia sp.]
MSAEAVNFENREVSWQLFARFISSITREEFGDLAPYLDLQVFPVGTVINSEGERSPYLGFLLTGKLSVRKANDFSGRSTLVAVLEKGAIFGERGLAGGLPADVSLGAMEESRALLLSYDRARQIIRNNPSLGVKILFSCLRVTGRRLQGSTTRIADIL